MVVADARHGRPFLDREKLFEDEEGFFDLAAELEKALLSGFLRHRMPAARSLAPTSSRL
jgi:hypothetical protein